MKKTAKWIWTEDNIENIYVNFKTTVECERDGAAKIKISVDGNYALWLNGRFVDAGQYPDYPEYKVYDVLDLYLKAGVNELFIIVHNEGRDNFSYRKETPGLFFEIYDEKGIISVSDESVASAVSAAYYSGKTYIVTGQLGYGFSYDMTKEGTEVYKKSVAVDKKVTMYQRPVKKVKIEKRQKETLCAHGYYTENAYGSVGERVYNASLTALPLLRPLSKDDALAEGKDGIYEIYDLGGETVGHIDLEFTTDKECDVIVGYGEHLADLRVRSYINGRNFAFTIHAKKGKNRFFMPLRRIALRYMEVHIPSFGAKVRYMGVRPTTYPLSEYPPKIADLLHKKIYDIGIKTLKCCMHDHYEDSPWREQGLYAMDSRNEILAGYGAFREYDFPKACLRLIALGTREDGLTEICSPCRCRLTIPSFTAVFLIEAGEYLDVTGDVGFMEEIYPYLKKISDSFISRIAGPGLIFSYRGKEYWNFHEWLPGLEGEADVHSEGKTPYDAPLCAFVAMGLSHMSSVASAIGRKDDSVKFKKARDRLVAGMRETFFKDGAFYSYYNPANGEIYGRHELTQALMILCGACPEDRKKEIADLLKSGRLPKTTLSHSIFKYDALIDADGENVKWVIDDISKIWGKMALDGADTFYETEEGQSAFLDAGSLCHGWSAVPVYYYHKYFEKKRKKTGSRLRPIDR